MGMNKLSNGGNRKKIGWEIADRRLICRKHINGCLAIIALAFIITFASLSQKQFQFFFWISDYTVYETRHRAYSICNIRLARVSKNMNINLASGWSRWKCQCYSSGKSAPIRACDQSYEQL
jgi:hypothetical protein